VSSTDRLIDRSIDLAIVAIFKHERHFPVVNFDLGDRKDGTEGDTVLVTVVSPVSTTEAPPLLQATVDRLVPGASDAHRDRMFFRESIVWGVDTGFTAVP